MADNDHKVTDNEPLILTHESGSEQTELPPSGTQPASPSSTPRTLGLWLVLLITLLLTLALGGAGYWYYQNKQGENLALLDAQQAQQSRMTALDQENRQLQQQLASLEASKAELGRSLNELTATTETLRRQTEQALAQLNNLNGRRPSDWLLAEADYLVRMAGRKVWLEKDLRTAIMLLENADARLEELNDPSVLPVRALIAQDIQTLNQVNPVSRTSVALAISGMLGQVDKLPMETIERPVDSSAGAEDAVSESVSDWQQNLLRVWHSVVDDFISVKRVDTPVEPMLDARQQYLIREQLKLQLMQAQSAAIGAEATLYQQSLQSCVQLLVERFDLERSEVNGFVSGIENLINTDVTQSLPAELASQQPLQDLVESRVKQVFGEGARSL